MRKAQIWTILGFLCAKLGFKLCAKILGLRIQSLDGADFCILVTDAASVDLAQALAGWLHDSEDVTRSNYCNAGHLWGKPERCSSDAMK